MRISNNLEFFAWKQTKKKKTCYVMLFIGNDAASNQAKCDP